MTPVRSTAKGRVLYALREAGSIGCTTAFLAQPSVGGVRFSARVKELRDEGYVIHERRLRAGSHLYHLVSDRYASQPDRAVIKRDACWEYERDGELVLDFIAPTEHREEAA